MPIRRTLLCLTAAAALYSGHAPQAGGTIEEQRELFKAIYPDAELGDWTAFEDLSRAQQRALEAYILWPDLKAAQLRATLKTQPAASIEAFLDDYATLRPARDLRYRYALQLARSGNHEGYLGIYRSYYQGRDIAKLDCLALAAEIALGKTRGVVPRAEALWLVGHSQADECDPVFAWARANDHLTEKHYRQRFELAIDARAFSRARWLGKSLSPDYVSRAEAWQRAAANPESSIRRDARATSDEAGERLVYALERLTFRDPVAALDLWRNTGEGRSLTADQRHHVERHIALWTARDGLPGAYELLAALPAAAHTTEVWRWRVRVALRDGDDDRALADIEAMPATEAARDEWQYWRAVVLERQGQAGTAQDILERLAAERSYYGFLAADLLGTDYAYDEAVLAPDDELLASLGQRPAFARARELYAVGLDSRGRSEWDLAVNYLSDPEKLQAALLAHRWGWHSRAIATAASAGNYDDLSLRYPLPYIDEFAAATSDASIPKPWAYGIARSESLFMRDVRSSAGAIGLMQLMPATGRDVARRLSIRYEGLPTLTNPATNIRLGTSYLGQMAERFDGNRVLATAAYNAGPHRVDRWLPDDGGIELRIWIENIPFNETRAYVRRVLAAETIFHWRLTGETRRLSSIVGDVLEAPADDAVARTAAAPPSTAANAR